MPKAARSCWHPVLLMSAVDVRFPAYGLAISVWRRTGKRRTFPELPSSSAGTWECASDALEA